jgi:helicase
MELVRVPMLVRRSSRSRYTVAEYKNISGRAGRLGLATRGSSYLIALNSNEEHYYWTRYVLGRPEDLISHLLHQGTDVRSLILRVLVAAEHTGHGMSREDIVGFLDSSFGVFLEKQRTATWRWDARVIESAVAELLQHGLIGPGKAGLLLTPLGRLSGVSGVEVESIIRIVGVFRSSTPDSLGDPALIAATQLTTELDEVLFPINKKSTQKEPQTWMREIENQGVPHSIIAGLRGSARDLIQPTLRAKKAVACLLWISGRPMNEIEATLTQFGGKFDGAAGPLRSARARTCDILPIVARIAELVHPSLDLETRVARLVLRLELGLPSSGAEIGRCLQDRLTRGEYLSLISAGFSSVAAIRQADDEQLLPCLGGRKARLAMLRSRLLDWQPDESIAHAGGPILPAYEP